MRDLLHQGIIVGVLFGIIIVKASVMTITPMSLDLVLLVRGVLEGSPWARSPYGAIIAAIIAAWRVLPVDHPDLTVAWTDQSFNPSQGLFLLVFLLKLPLLVFEALTGILLFSATKRLATPDRAVHAALLWFMNPYLILVNEMWGATDIVPAFFLSLAACLYSARGKIFSSISYGLAVGLKLFSIFTLPAFLAAQDERSKRLAALVSAVVGVVLYELWLVNAGFDPLAQLTRYDPVTLFFDEVTVQTPSGARIGIGIITLVLLYVFMLEKWKKKASGARQGSLLIFLIYFAFTNWYPPFLVWLIPFLTFDILLENRSKSYLIALLSSATFIAFVGFRAYLTSNGRAFLFAPVQGNVWLTQALTGYVAFASQDLTLALGFPMARAVFSSVCLIYAMRLVEEHTGFLSSIRTVLGRLSRGD